MATLIQIQFSPYHRSDHTSILDFYVYMGDFNKYITNIFILSKQINVLIICYRAGKSRDLDTAAGPKLCTITNVNYGRN